MTGLDADYASAIVAIFTPNIRDPLGRGAPEPPFYRPVSVFEYHIRVVEGLLGAFEVSGDRRLLHAAAHAADVVLGSFAFGSVPRPRACLAHPWRSPVLWGIARIIDAVAARFDDERDCASLAATGSFGLALRVLTRETGDGRYAAAADRVGTNTESRRRRRDDVDGLEHGRSMLWPRRGRGAAAATTWMVRGLEHAASPRPRRGSSAETPTDDPRCGHGLRHE